MFWILLIAIKFVLIALFYLFVMGAPNFLELEMCTLTFQRRQKGSRPPTFTKHVEALIFSEIIVKSGGNLCANQPPPQRVGVSPPVKLGQNGCWSPRESQMPWPLPKSNIFLLCCPQRRSSRPPNPPIGGGQANFGGPS